MPETTKEDLEVRIKEQAPKQIQEYRKVFTLDSNGSAMHETTKIQGTLNYFIFQNDSENELDIKIHPVEHPLFLLHIKKHKRFGVYPWKVLSINSIGEEITAPEEWSKVVFNDKLFINVSGGQAGIQVELRILYGN